MSDVSAVTNYFATANEGFTSTVGGSGVSSGGATVPLTSTSGLTDGSIFVGIVEPGLTNQQVFTGTVDIAGGQITGVKWTRGTNVAHAAGVTVVDYVTGTGFNMMSVGILKSLDQDGTLKAGAVDVAAVVANSILTRAKLTTGFNAELQKSWFTGDLPAVSSVTFNGNGSYDMTFASSVASLLSVGMRIRTTRTVTAPTQCTSLNGTTQFYNRASASVAAIAFTNNFVCSAWIYVNAYQAEYIVSRYNGTSGWGMSLGASGQVIIAGWNAGSGNNMAVTSTQSVPLNKWVHVTAQMDMTVTTNTATTNYVMIDGVDVPATATRSGTSPTSLLQAGNLEIGSFNGGLSPFNGKIAQVAVYSAKVTQATIRTSMSQTLTGSETSILVAYSFNGVITDLTSNAYTLTANGSAVATNADSPFANATGTPNGSTDVAVVQAVGTTTITVQVPKGCTIPTSGGVSTVDYATSYNPYGWAYDKNRWVVGSYYRVQTTATPTVNQFVQFNSMQLTAPVGPAEISHQVAMYNGDGAAPNTIVYWTLSTSTAAVAAGSEEDITMSGRTQNQVLNINIFDRTRFSKFINSSSATPYYLMAQRTSATITIGCDADNGPAKIEWMPAGV